MIPGAMDWEPPDEFDEYRLVRRLGAGAMGAVYLAQDRLLDRAVAIKFLTASLTETARLRFVVEARAAARIHHPNVMGIHRVGELGEHPYIVAEYVRGQSLADLEVPLPWDRVLQLGIGLARGLATAHRQGVLHRDIKLSNAILEEESGEVKLLDFSLAKVELGDEAQERSDGEAPPEAAPRPTSAPPEGDEAPASAAPGEGEAPASAAPGADEGSLNQTMWDPETDEEAMAGGDLLQSASRLDGNWQEGAASLTQHDALVGTPHYMAPELWNTLPATRQTDIYALGVLLYILGTGKPPHAALSPQELGLRVVEQPAPPVRDTAPAMEPRLAAIIDRCLALDPTDRFAGGDALREALESALGAGRPRPELGTDNPYRGLQAFEAEHRELFFGRGAELRAVLDRLRAEPFVLVAGDSGVGKSSLCRAGVGPSVVERAIEPERRWSYATITPGRHPLRTLTSVLVSHFDLEPDVVLSVVESRPDTLGWLIHKKLGRGTGKLLFVDQFEELVTLSDRKEAEVVGRILAQLAAGIPGVRLLATVRGDFLTRAADIPHIGDELARAIYLLRPLSEAGVREAIVGPAEAMNVRYESETLVDELVAAGVESSLPILQFALAELWEAREPARATITATDLADIGGVTGALARHAEGLMAALLPKQRLAAKEQLLRLVTIDDTRARLSATELVHGEDDGRLALEALVRGRLLVVREDQDDAVYEIAHEALIREWANLRRWLEEAKEARALRHRLEVAAAEWERLQRPRAGLWNSAQMVEAAGLPRRGLRAHEGEFLDASARAVAWGRRLRRVALVAIPGALVATYGLLRYQAHTELQQRVEARVAEAEASLREAEAGHERYLAARAAAFAKFDTGDEAAGTAWGEAKAQGEATDRQLQDAARELERALTLDPTRQDVRGRLGDALLRRAELAEARGEPTRVDELVERVSLYDEGGERMARWNAPASLTVTTSPPGARVELLEYRRDDDGRRIPSELRPLGDAPLRDVELTRGSYRLQVTAPERPPVLYPILVGRGESLAVSVEVPPAEAIPEGFTYVPAGRSLLGCQDEALCDVFYNSFPIHHVDVGAFFIGTHEVTFGDWIEFLESMPASQRAELAPRIDHGVMPVTLEPVEPSGWALTISQQRAGSTEPMVIPARERRRAQPWAQLPAMAIKFPLARAYVSWLDASGRVPGARLCTEHEWERAGRGADGRLYPHGDHIDVDDLNIDITYGKNSDTWGVDAVGSHPASSSPFGVQDLSGNVGEWTSNPLDDEMPVLRGGAFMMDAISAHLVSRSLVPPDFTDGSLGLRVCAPYSRP